MYYKSLPNLFNFDLIILSYPSYGYIYYPNSYVKLTVSTYLCQLFIININTEILILVSFINCHQMALLINAFKLIYSLLV